MVVCTLISVRKLGQALQYGWQCIVTDMLNARHFEWVWKEFGNSLWIIQMLSSRWRKIFCWWLLNFGSNHFPHRIIFFHCCKCSYHGRLDSRCPNISQRILNLAFSSCRLSLVEPNPSLFQQIQGCIKRQLRSVNLRAIRYLELCALESLSYDYSGLGGKWQVVGILIST